jgi:hypothetical protein
MGPAGAAGATGPTGAAGTAATVAEVPADGQCGPGRAGATITDGAGNSVVVCDGAAGPTGPTGVAGPIGLPGVTGQNGLTTTGAAVTLSTPGVQTPLLALTFSVPSVNSSVFVTTDGEFLSNATTANSEILVDFDLILDGVQRRAYRRQFLRKDESGGFSAANIRGQWSFSVLMNNLQPSLSHTLTVLVSLAGTSPAGGSATVCTSVAPPTAGCQMSVLVLNR